MIRGFIELLQMLAVAAAGLAALVFAAAVAVPFAEVAFAWARVIAQGMMP